MDLKMRSKINIGFGFSFAYDLASFSGLITVIGISKPFSIVFGFSFLLMAAPN